MAADFCRVHAPRSTFPVDAVVTVADKNGQLRKKTAFSVRIGNSTRELADEAERRRYIAAHWGRTGS